ncbi:hypothetical protein ACP70R_003722 [Stipagrostis hirtigluma subsp. patula]
MAGETSMDDNAATSHSMAGETSRDDSTSASHEDDAATCHVLAAAPPGTRTMQPRGRRGHQARTRRRRRRAQGRRDHQAHTRHPDHRAQGRCGHARTLCRRRHRRRARRRRNARTRPNIANDVYGRMGDLRPCLLL